MEQNQRRRFWMLGPMVVVALLSGVLIGKGWERTGHATETYEELRTFSEVSNSSPEKLCRRDESQGSRPRGDQGDVVYA